MTNSYKYFQFKITIYTNTSIVHRIVSRKEYSAYLYKRQKILPLKMILS